MITVAIVGASKLNENEESDARQLCATILRSYTDEITVISGGAEGVDIIAIEIAKGLGLKTQEYLQEINEWESLGGKVGYKERNLKIAIACDDIYCIATQVHDLKCYHHGTPEDHQKTAGCWTLKKALEINKHVRLMVTMNRNE